jgi:hypothetical protein
LAPPPWVWSWCWSLRFTVTTAAPVCNTIFLPGGDY